jgi:hypothetical protein
MEELRRRRSRGHSGMVMGVHGLGRAWFQFHRRVGGHGPVSRIYRRPLDLAERLGCRDNWISLIENFPPPKADVLGYFDADAASPQRFAKVNLFF